MADVLRTLEMMSAAGWEWTANGIRPIAAAKTVTLLHRKPMVALLREDQYITAPLHRRNCFSPVQTAHPYSIGTILIIPRYFSPFDEPITFIKRPRRLVPYPHRKRHTPHSPPLQ